MKLTAAKGGIDANTGRLYKVGFQCEPDQVEFVQHMITNVALLANTNRDVPDSKGRTESFIAYEAFASTRPVTSCDQLFLLEAYPDAESQRLHGEAAYKNGLEILQVLRGTRADNGLPGFNFARDGLLHTYVCGTDCGEEIQQLKVNLIRTEELMKEHADEVPQKTDLLFTGGIQGHGVNRFKKSPQKTAEKLMRHRESKKFIDKEAAKKGKAEAHDAKKKKEVRYENDDDELAKYTLSHGPVPQPPRFQHANPSRFEDWEDEEQGPELNGLEDDDVVDVHGVPMRLVPAGYDEDYRDDPQRLMVVHHAPVSPNLVHVVHNEVHHHHHHLLEQPPQHHIVYEMNPDQNFEVFPSAHEIIAPPGATTGDGRTYQNGQ